MFCNGAVTFRRDGRYSAGGIDLIFPHHEDEIAQSEGTTGKTFCNHWMHVEHLLVDHKKMSKSLGNFYTLRDLLSKGYTGRVIRFALLQTHYRVSFNFTLQVLDAAKLSCQRISDFIVRLEEEQEKLANGLEISYDCFSSSSRPVTCYPLWSIWSFF